MKKEGQRRTRGSLEKMITKLLTSVFFSTEMVNTILCNEFPYLYLFLTIFMSSYMQNPFLKSGQVTFLLKCSMSYYRHIKHPWQALTAD